MSNKPAQSNFLNYITHSIETGKPFQNANVSQEFNTSQILNQSLEMYNQNKVRSSSIKEPTCQSKYPNNSSFKDSNKKQPLSSKVKSSSKKQKKHDISLYNQLNKLVRQTNNFVNKKDNTMVIDELQKNKSPTIQNNYLKSAKEKTQSKKSKSKNTKLSNLLKLSFNNNGQQQQPHQIGNLTATTQSKKCDNLKEIRAQFQNLYLRRTPSTSINASTPLLDSQGSNAKNSPNLNFNPDSHQAVSLLNSHKERMSRPIPQPQTAKQIMNSKSQRSLYNTLLPKTSKTSQKLKNWLQNTPSHIVMRFMKDAKVVNEYRQSIQGLVGFIVNLKTPYVFTCEMGRHIYVKQIQGEIKLVKGVTDQAQGDYAKWKEIMKNKVNYVSKQRG